MCVLSIVVRRPPRVTRTDTLFPYTTLFRSGVGEDLTVGKNKDLSTLIQKVKNEDNLLLLPAGTIPPNPAELLMTREFDKLIEELRLQFDYILIDNPPVNIVADTKISNRCADFTAYIVRAGVLDRKDLNIIEDIYQSHILKNMGLILTDVDYERLYYSLGYKGYGKVYGVKYSTNNNYYSIDKN